MTVAVDEANGRNDILWSLFLKVSLKFGGVVNEMVPDRVRVVQDAPARIWHDEGIPIRQVHLMAQIPKCLGKTFGREGQIVVVGKSRYSLGIEGRVQVDRQPLSIQAVIAAGTSVFAVGFARTSITY